MAGQYTRRTTCRCCHGRNLSLVLDLGEMALAGGFLMPHEFGRERTYPLELFVCSDCSLLQVVTVVPREILFGKYFYFSSAIKTLRDHFAEYAREVSSRFLVPGRSFVVEIGCNDGVLLRPFRERGMRVLGVDPATNVVTSLVGESLNVLNEFFTEEIAGRILREHGPADLVVANNVYAHVDDMHDITRGISALLGPDGLFVFEVHYLGNLIEEMQYDMIYHEHLSYYSLLSLENFFRQFEMEIFDVQPVPIHAGSMRYYVRQTGGSQGGGVSERVRALREEERAKRYDRVDTYLDYAGRVARKRRELLDLVRGVRQSGKSLVGYGASGRANTMIQYCGLDQTLIDYLIDDAPAKQGFYSPGAHLEIKPRQSLETIPPDYVLVFAWAFVEEIRERCREYMRRGGKLIIPLPDLRVLSLRTDDAGADSVCVEAGGRRE